MAAAAAAGAGTRSEFPGASLPIPKKTCPFSIIADHTHKGIVRIVREYLSHLNDLYLEFAMRDFGFTPHNSVFLSAVPGDVNWKEERSPPKASESHQSVFKYPFVATVSSEEGGTVFRCDTLVTAAFRSPHSLDTRCFYANHNFLVVNTITDGRGDGLFVYGLASGDSFHLPCPGLQTSRFVDETQIGVLCFRDERPILEVWDVWSRQTVDMLDFSPWDAPDLALNFDQLYLRFNELVIPSSSKREYVYTISSREPHLAPALRGGNRATVFTIAEEAGAALLGWRSLEQGFSHRLYPILRFGSWERRLDPIDLPMRYVRTCENHRESYGLSCYVGLFRHDLVVSTHDGLKSLNLVHPFAESLTPSFVFWGNYMGTPQPHALEDRPATYFDIDGDRMLLHDEAGNTKLLRATTFGEDE